MRCTVTTCLSPYILDTDPKVLEYKQVVREAARERQEAVLKADREFEQKKKAAEAALYSHIKANAPGAQDAIIETEDGDYVVRGTQTGDSIPLPPEDHPWARVEPLDPGKVIFDWGVAYLVSGTWSPGLSLVSRADGSWSFWGYRRPEQPSIPPDRLETALQTSRANFPYPRNP